MSWFSDDYYIAYSLEYKDYTEVEVRDAEEQTEV